MFDGDIYAGFWKRVAAYLLDLLIVVAAAFAIGLVFALLGLLDGDSSEALFNALGFFGFWLYVAVLESGPAMATFAKRALRIKVTDLDGQRISFGRATRRYFGQILSSIILVIGYLMAGWTSRKQALHDMVASCLVVNATALEAGAVTGRKAG